MVMAVANRALSSPLSVWGDQSDVMAVRDTGWIQLFVENGQETVDNVLCAFRIGEDPRVLLPVMVHLDGFYLSHMIEPMLLPEKSEVDRFLPPFTPNALLNPDEPMSLTMGASDRLYTKWRHEQFQAIQAAAGVIEAVDKEYGKLFGRSYGGLVDAYRCRGADAIIVTMGGLATGAAKEAVDSLRKDGVKAGVLKLRAFRPFPAEAVRKHLASTKQVIVVDRDCSYGYEGALCSEVKAALCSLQPCPRVTNFIGGMGGADITPDDVQNLVMKAIKTTPHKPGGVIFQYQEGE